LLEAGACGIFSLANNCPGGINEIIENNINGEISNIENHKAFSQDILRIVEQNHSKEAIINSIKLRFSKEIIMKKYESVLDNI